MALTISGVRINGALTAVHIPASPPPPPYLWSWGSNSVGQLGLGNTTNFSSPKQVGALTNWLTVSAGNYFNIAVKNDGTMWGWGDNRGHGQLGIGNTTYYSSPKQVGALTNWADVSAGVGFALGRKTDGTLWSWGRNYRYSLGIGDTTSRSSPVQIGSATNWLKITAGSYHAFAINTSGDLYGWGSIQFGQVGNGTSNSNAGGGVATPSQISGTWSEIAASTARHTLGIKSNGTLWGWGSGFRSALGLGNTTDYSSPKQIGALTNWISIAAGSYTSLAVKTDGTMWSWGSNYFGELGLNNTSQVGSPTQVGALTNWYNSISIDKHVSAIKTDGTLWTWGRNSEGQLGLGDTNNRSSPVQVGALTAWLTVSAGRYHTVAIG
jgi:alpha-tubulin suppressor-like RCC1 family protein